MAELFRENGIEYDQVNYFIEPLTAAKIGELISKTGLRPVDVVRRGAKALAEIGIDGDAPDAIICQAIAADPNLLQRPIVEIGDKAVVARPIEKALELIEWRSGRKHC